MLADLAAAKEAQEANKLAGSKGAASVKELFAKHEPETIRFFLLATHYRSPIDFSDERIAETGKSLEGFTVSSRPTNEPPASRSTR